LELCNSLGQPPCQRGTVDTSFAWGQKTRVQIHPGFKVFRENIAIMFCIHDFTHIVCVLKKRNKGRNKGIGPIIF
jgi:hypothetical protein